MRTRGGFQPRGWQETPSLISSRDPSFCKEIHGTFNKRQLCPSKIVSAEGFTPHDREQSVNNLLPNTRKQQVLIRAKPTKNQQDKQPALSYELGGRRLEFWPGQANFQQLSEPTSSGW